MISTKPLLLTGTALLLLVGAASTTNAAANDTHNVVAQAAPPEAETDKKGEHKPPAKGAPSRREGQPAPHQPPQAHPKPPEHAPAPQQQHAQPAAPEHKPPEKPAAAPAPREAPKAAQQPAPSQQKAEPRREERRQERRDERRQETAPQPSTAAPAKPATSAPPPPAAQAPTPQKPAAQSAPAPQKPAAQTAPATPPSHNAQTNAPANRTAPAAAPAAAPTAAPAAVPAPAAAPPSKPQSAQQFILPKNGKPTVTLQDVRKDRHETREGNRTVITEGDRTIVKQDNRTIIRHSEAQRFAVGARDVNVERHGNETTTVIVRPDGDRIINVTDERGHLIRRVRRERDGREVVIIDERSAGPRRDVFVDLPPPVVRIPRDRYIVEVDRARPETIYEVLDAPPVERVDRRYTVDQVRYSAPLRERMPRVDLDINFDTGSWQLTPDQIDKLSVVAQGLNRAIHRNPREVFLIEGHTDAVGSDEDNLSLSDRRAESVAVALTEQFHVPPENLVTQGYGEQNLKVQTQEASRANRRVSVRRITPLIDQQAGR